MTKLARGTVFSFISTAALAALLLTLGCRNNDGAAQDVTWAQVRNLTYPSAVTEGQAITLTDGFGPAEEGASPSERLVDVGAFGDLGGGDGADAVVFLAERVSDDEQVTSVIAVVDDGEEAEIDGSTELGVNVAIDSVSIDDDRITVRLLGAGTADPETGEAPVLTKHFELKRDGLELIEDEAIVAPVRQIGDFQFSPEPLGATSEEGEEVSVSLAPRGVAPFVISGFEGQAVNLGLSSPNGSAILSIQGVTDQAQVVPFRDYSTAFTGYLPADQDYLVNVRSVSGTDLDVTFFYQLAAPPVPTATPAPLAPPQTAGELAVSIPQLFTGVAEYTDAALGGVSQAAAEFVPGRSPINGAAVVVPNDGLVYSENADEQMETASVIKVVVMTCVMARAEAQGRLVTDGELSLMWPMITYSDNDATDALWSELGGGPGVAACLQNLGVGGITPYDGPYWGTSTASARGMAELMARIAYGDIVNAEHRAAALAMLVSVVLDQRWGVPAGADSSGEEIVGVKDGWYPDDDGWRVNSVGFISPLASGQAPYAIAVMTNLQGTQEYGIATIEGVAEPVWNDIRAR